MRVSVSTCERLHVYIPTTANFIACERLITERIGGLTHWLADGHWQGIEELVQVFEIIGGKHSMGALAYEIGQQYLKDNPNEVECMCVVTDKHGTARYSFFHN